jgi:DNA polymerase-3 subunit gamma/tau
VIRSLSDASSSPPPQQNRPGNGGGATVGALASPSPRPGAQALGGNLGGPSGSISRGAPNAALASAPARDTITRLPDAESTAPALVVGRFEDLIALAAQKRDLGVKLALERDVRLVRYEDGRLEIRLEQSAAKTLVNDLARKFSQWTNRRWMVVVSAEEGQPTVKSQNDARQAELKTGVRADPLVQAVLARFPGAEIVDVRKGEMPQALPPGDPDNDDPGDGAPELPVEDDSSAFGAHGDPDESEL